VPPLPVNFMKLKDQFLKLRSEIREPDAEDEWRSDFHHLKDWIFQDVERITKNAEGHTDIFPKDWQGDLARLKDVLNLKTLDEKSRRYLEYDLFAFNDAVVIHILKCDHSGSGC